MGMMMRVSCRFLSRLSILAIIVLLVLSLAIFSTGGKGWSAEPLETIPDENDQLTLSELRWCIFEDIRLEGESNEIDAFKGWEVNDYNVRINQYNRRCSNKSYYERDENRIQSELTVAKRQYLQSQGALRAKKARVEREERRVYVNSEVASVLAGPNYGAEELGRVPRWEDLIKTGRKQGAWYEVEWQAPSMDNVLKYGWILGGFLESGSGSEAHVRYCEGRVPKPRPKHNDIIENRLDLHTNSEFAVENGLRDDAYVKLVREHDKAVIALFAAAGKTALLRGIPYGSYTVAFGTGSIFDRGRRTFCIRGAAQIFDRQLDYDVHTGGWELTLQAVSGGNARTSSISYDEFDKL